MNRKDFSTILANPSKIDQDQFEEISSIVKEFPYFQAGKIIFLKMDPVFLSKKFHEERVLIPQFVNSRVSLN